MIGAGEPRAGEVLAPRSDQDWVRALADRGPAGDPARRDLRIVLVRGLRSMLASRGATDLSEDCAQEALVRIGQRLADYRGQSRLTTWALSIATRVAFDELRHSRWKDLSLDAMTADARGPVSFEPQVDANQERSLVRQRVLDRLREVIERDLTDKQRLVLVAELNGTPHLEIAREMGTTRNALYKLSHDARRRVKRHLEASGISAADVLWVFE